jgi:D-aminopeptidase
MSVGRPRAREFGIRIGSLEPGKYNSITDVQDVRVGHVTLMEGEGPLDPGHGPVRTGVTVVLPHNGNLFKEKVKAASFIINGFGKSIGMIQIDELGVLETPILLTNALNVGVVADALVEYMLNMNPDIGVTTGTVNPVVCECNDGFLNDIRGRHVRNEHVKKALTGTTDGPVEEGAVGAGTGMSAFELKGGIGSSSRIVPKEFGGYVVGALVLSNFGLLNDLRIDGVPVGQELSKSMVPTAAESGSIIILVATNAPATSRQLKRMARRATHGLARTGSISGHGSGDIVLAFSTVNRVPHYKHDAKPHTGSVFEEDMIWLFRGVVESTEEAILNSLFKARTIVGRDGNKRIALPLEETREILRKFGRIS